MVLVEAARHAAGWTIQQLLWLLTLRIFADVDVEFCKNYQ